MTNLDEMPRGAVHSTGGALHTGGTWSPDTHAGGPPTRSAAASPAFDESYIDVSTVGLSFNAAATFSSRAEWEQTSRTALLAALQGAVLADLLDAARAAFAVWYLVVTEDTILGSKTSNYQTTYAL